MKSSSHLHIAPYSYGSRPHDLHSRRRSSQKVASWGIVFLGFAATALLTILFLTAFSMWPRGNFKNAAENWLLDISHSQVQTMGDHATKVRVAHYTALPPEGWRVADANEVKYLFGKGLALEPQTLMVTSSKTVATEGFSHPNAASVFGRFKTHSVFVKNGDALLTVVFLKYGEVKTELLPADLDFWHCKTVLVQKEWKRPIDVQGDRRVATTDSRTTSK